jgi:hypothetical protein
LSFTSKAKKIPTEERNESLSYLPKSLVPTAHKFLGYPEEELVRKLRFPLMQKVYVEHLQVPEVCEAIRSDK